MIHILALTNTTEIALLKDLVAHVSMQYFTVEYEFHVIHTVSELTHYISKVVWNDVLVFDVTLNGVIEVVKNARAKYPNMIILPIADGSIPPSIYVQPDIMPYGLLWRPLSHKSCKLLIERVLSDVMINSVRKNDAIFTVKTKTTTYHIPYRSIYYFESKNKRISLRTENNEIQFYYTLSKLEEEVPTYFFRCHHSFIVNSNYVISIDWTTMSVQMRDKITLPISRHYRTVLKEKLYGDGSL